MADRSPVPRAESMLRTCVEYGADESRLRAAFARLPASMGDKERVEAAWSEATGVTAPEAETDAVVQTSPVPLGPPERTTYTVLQDGYTPKDWAIGWATLAILAVLTLALLGRCL